MFSSLIHTWPTFVCLVIFNNYLLLVGTGLFPDFALMPAFASHFHIRGPNFQHQMAGEQWITPRLQVPALKGTWSYSCTFPSFSLQSFCCPPELLLLYLPTSNTRPSRRQTSSYQWYGACVKVSAALLCPQGVGNRFYILWKFFKIFDHVPSHCILFQHQKQIPSVGLAQKAFH